MCATLTDRAQKWQKDLPNCTTQLSYINRILHFFLTKSTNHSYSGLSVGHSSKFGQAIAMAYPARNFKSQSHLLAGNFLRGWTIARIGCVSQLICRKAEVLDKWICTDLQSKNDNEIMPVCNAHSDTGSESFCGKSKKPSHSWRSR